MKINIINTILTINPNAVVSVSGDDVNQIEWLENTPVIDSATILAKQSELQALEDVYEKRRKEYGTVVSQLDEIYHNGMDSWKARIAQIKADNPKE
jgi:CII-binding regulator of phage lambda lysogenization HflD